MTKNLPMEIRKSIIKKWDDNAKGLNLFCHDNKVVICGKVEDDFVYSHRGQKEEMEFYRTRIICSRENGQEDFIPIVISDELKKNIKKYEPIKNKWAEVLGTVRTYRSDAKDGHRYMNLYVLVTKINIYQDRKEDEVNLIYLKGHICKKMHCSDAKTDILLSVKINKTRTDNIPCLVWGKSRELASVLPVGEKVSFYGRFQSREYKKRTDADTDEINVKVAYEIATNKICLTSKTPPV